MTTAGGPVSPGRVARRRTRVVGAVRTGLLLLAATLTGCGPRPVVIPPGGQQLHVIVDGDVVHLQPTTVRAGEVYLVLDVPETNVSMVERLDAPAGSPGPLTDDDLDRLAHGDTFHTRITAGFANGEPYGNVSRLVLAPGKYAFLVDGPELLAARYGGIIPPDSLAVLLVAP